MSRPGRLPPPGLRAQTRTLHRPGRLRRGSQYTGRRRQSNRKAEQLHEVRHVACPEAHGRDVYQQLLPVFRQVCRDQARLGDMLAGLKI